MVSILRWCLVGKPEVRKYCTPLQAMYWLLLENKINIFNQIVQKYDLKLLLDKSWGQGIKGPYIELSSEKVHAIAKSINGKEGTYAPGNVSTDVLKKVIIYHYFENPRIFTKNHKELMMKALNNEINNRWNDFDTVINRINSPELVEKYLEDYEYRRMYMPQSPKTTIKTKQGDCKAYAILACTALKTSGHKAYLYTMDPKSMAGHTICVFKEERLYTLDNTAGLRGPFETLSHIDNKWGYSYGIVESVPELYNRFN